MFSWLKLFHHGVRVQLVITAAAISLLAGCAINPVSGKRELHLFTDDDEITLGLETKKSVIKQYDIYNDPALQKYIEGIGKKLALTGERPELPYNFTILDTPVVNAFAAPGGAIFVTRGILNEMRNEAELAAVLGHEVGHVTGRHSMGALEKQYGYKIIFELTSVLTKKDLSSMKPYADTLAGVIVLGYGRDNEFEADNSGLRYCIAAGYDPGGMASFFKRLEKMEGTPPSKLENLFQSHPPTAERIRRAEEFVRSKSNVRNPANLDEAAYKERIKGLPKK